MRILPRKSLSTDAAINLVILLSGSCLAICLYLLGPAFSVMERPAFDGQLFASSTDSALTHASGSR